LTGGHDDEVVEVKLDFGIIEAAGNQTYAATWEVRVADLGNLGVIDKEGQGLASTYGGQMVAFFFDIWVIGLRIERTAFAVQTFEDFHPAIGADRQGKVIV
jgi:hypothetical protein